MKRLFPEWWKLIQCWIRVFDQYGDFYSVDESFFPVNSSTELKSITQYTILLWLTVDGKQYLFDIVPFRSYFEAKTSKIFFSLCASERQYCSVSTSLILSKDFSFYIYWSHVVILTFDIPFFQNMILFYLHPMFNRIQNSILDFNYWLRLLWFSSELTFIVEWQQINSIARNPILIIDYDH